MEEMQMILFHLIFRMKNYFLIIAALLLLSACEPKSEINPDFTTVFEKSNGTKTPTYREVIEYYSDLASYSASVKLMKMGETDSGQPLHLVLFNAEGDFDLKNTSNLKLLINNGIHPGESDGIDATILLYRDLVEGKISLDKGITIAAIPIYNIGGALNRNTSTRANQNGPLEYGFRGNSRNFDLNRDFIKADSKNARSFARLFQFVNPDLFIDNHVSNGADYQYSITHLFSQSDKFGGASGDFIKNTWQPYLEKEMKKLECPISPYVNVFGRTPDSGFSQFMDYPRYSTGYASLFNTMGMMVETHMLKPYKERVESTYKLLETNLRFGEKYKREIRNLKQTSWKEILAKKTYPLAFEIDETKYVKLNFEGYEGEFIPSAIGDYKRLYYDHDKPFTKELPYFNSMKSTMEVKIPDYYIVPQSQWQVIQRLDENNIKWTTLPKDTTMTVTVSYIDSFKTRENPYEGHYLHYNSKSIETEETVSIFQGDLLISTDQPGVKYLIETLEIQAIDSFFNWNYFDAILQQKEGFSPYVFEDYALNFLEENPNIKADLIRKQQADPDFKASGYDQLNWIFKQTPLFETALNRYPIYKMSKG
jgi:hypothetical protein